jgi:membrane associated rhomboid family serine protease
MAKHTVREELAGVVAFVGVVWAVFLVDLALPGRLPSYGLTPRTTHGLVGIVTMPFLHANLEHIVSNTVPLIVLLVLLAGSRPRSWTIVAGIVLVSGVLLWLFGRRANHIGASGLIYGLIAYLFVGGILERRFVPLAIALVVGFLYGGTLAAGVVPRVGSYVSWDGHLCGAIAGALIAYGLNRGLRDGRDRASALVG